MFHSYLCVRHHDENTSNSIREDSEGKRNSPSQEKTSLWGRKRAPRRQSKTPRRSKKRRLRNWKSVVQGLGDCQEQQMHRLLKRWKEKQRQGAKGKHLAFTLIREADERFLETWNKPEREDPSHIGRVVCNNPFRVHFLSEFSAVVKFALT